MPSGDSVTRSVMCRNRHTKSGTLILKAMSEFWVSKKKYFCKYCDIYIADDAPSRQHHENGLRHKGNVERFIRGLYKGSEKRKKELEEEKRDMARVEMASEHPSSHSHHDSNVSIGSTSSLLPRCRLRTCSSHSSSSLWFQSTPGGKEASTQAFQSICKLFNSGIVGLYRS
jgi:hypothetical protein